MPVLVIERPLKVATPATAFTGVVPLSVPLPGLARMAMPTEAVLPVPVVTMLLLASFT